MFCNMCGFQLPDDALFCPRCGTKVPVEVPLVKEAENMPENTPVLSEKVVLAEEKEAEEKETKEEIEEKEAVEKTEASSDGTKGADLLSTLKVKLKRLVDDFKKLTILGKIWIGLSILLLAGFGILILIQIIRLIFSSVISVLVTAAIGYIIYQHWIAAWVTYRTYEIKYENEKLYLPEDMTAKMFLEALSGKFNYPYFNGVWYGENGECVIGGRYASYSIGFEANNEAYIIMDNMICGPNADKKARTILLEAIAIRSYINKFFNPTMAIDVTKDFKKLKSAELQRKMVSAVVSAAFILGVAAIVFDTYSPGVLEEIVEPGMEVRNAHLSQYSETVTIEEAFDNFFENGKWKKYKDEDYTYVSFTGVCDYLGERADVKVTFKITGENFIVDRVDINGQEQNNLVAYALLSEIYESY